MKKQLLTLALGVLSTLSFGQDFVQTQDNTGFTYIGDNMENDGMVTSVWGSLCSGDAGAGGGGTNEEATNSLRFGWGLGEAGRIFNIIELTTPIDLSAAANQKLQVTLKSTVDNASGTALPLNYYLRLENGNNETLLEQNASTLLNVTGTDQTFNVDFSDEILSGKDLSSVKKVIFLFDGCSESTFPINAWLFMSNLKIGSPLNVTSVNEAQKNIAKSNVYPNPSSEIVNVDLELKSSSDVKITLNDIYGREVKVIADGNYSIVSENFNVGELAKGMYTVTYFLNNSPAKTEILMVK